MAELMNIDFQNCFIFILLGLLSVLCYSFFFTKPKYGFDLAPSPPSLPIIGHLHHFLSLVIHKSLQNLSSKYGPILNLRIFSVPIALVSSPSIAYEIFKAQDGNVSTRNLPTNEGSLFFGPLGLGTAPYGEYWKLMKKIIMTNLLGPQALERSQSVRANELERFYSNLLDKAMKNESVKIAEEAMKLINNIICKMIMGSSCSEENGEAERVRGLVTKSDTLLKKFFLAAILRKPLKKIGISLFKKELVEVSRQFDEVLEKILVEYEEKQKEHNQGSALMDKLLETYGDEKHRDLLIAGTDTSTHHIQWTMGELINNPHVLGILREEIDSVVGKARLIQETDLSQLPYLLATIKEVLRLHPLVPLVIRTFQKECKIGGFHVPENTTLIVNSYAIMRNPDYWEDPLEFKPERFLASSRFGQEDKIREEVLKYLPFGSGRRGCPGTNLAYAFVGTAIGVMVQCFDWKVQGDKVNMDEDPGAILLSMAHPLQCIPLRIDFIFFFRRLRECLMRGRLIFRFSSFVA